MKISRSTRWFALATLLAATTLCLSDLPLEASTAPAKSTTLGGPQTGTGTTDVTRGALPPPPNLPAPPPPTRGGS